MKEDNKNPKKAIYSDLAKINKKDFGQHLEPTVSPERIQGVASS